jgi:hypothetical protein
MFSIIKTRVIKTLDYLKKSIVTNYKSTKYKASFGSPAWLLLSEFLSTVTGIIGLSFHKLSVNALDIFSSQNSLFSEFS